MAERWSRNLLIVVVALFGCGIGHRLYQSGVTFMLTGTQGMLRADQKCSVCGKRTTATTVVYGLENRPLCNECVVLPRGQEIAKSRTLLAQ